MRIRRFCTVLGPQPGRPLRALLLVVATAMSTACTTLLGNDFRFESDAGPARDAASEAGSVEGGGPDAGGTKSNDAGGKKAGANDGASGEMPAEDAGPEAGLTTGPILVSPTLGLLTTESGGQATFGVVLRDAPTTQVVIALSSTNTSEGNVSPASLVFTIDNWNAPQVVTVTGVDDGLPDGNQVYRILVGPAASDDGQYSQARGPDVSITNIDDETAGITVIPTRGVTTTEAGGSDTFTVVLNSKPSADVAIAVSSSNPDEGKVSPATLTFTPVNWRAPQLVTVTGVDDAVKDGPVKYSVVLSPASSADESYNGRDPEDVEVTNIDDDTAGFSLLPAGGLSTSEKGTKATFTLALNVAPSSDVAIALSSSNPKEGSVSPAKLVFTPQNWKAPQSVIVTGVDDSVADGNQVYQIVTAPAESEDSDYNHLDPPNVSVVNIDDDSPGFTVTPTAGLETTEAAGGSTTFHVVLNSKPTANVFVPLSSSNPLEGVNSPEALTFTQDNWSAPQVVTITGVNDDVADGNQPYTIRIGAATSSDPRYAGIDPPDVSVTNVDNDSPSIKITKSKDNLETSEKGDSATFTVVLGSKPIADVRIPLTSSTTAEGTVSPSLLIFTPLNYSAPQTVTIKGADDAIADGNQPYTIRTGAAQSDDSKYNGMDAADVSVINRDDDSAGIIVTPATSDTSRLVTTERGDTATFTVRLQSQPKADVVVSMSSSNTQEGTISPLTLTFTSLNWNAPQTVTLKGQDDQVADGNQNYRVVFAAISSTDASYGGLALADVLASNVDNDTAGITVTPISGLRTYEGSTAAASFTIVLNSQPAAGATVKIDLSVSSDTEGSVRPTSVTFTTANWDARQTISVTGVDDAVADGDQSYTIITGKASSTDSNYNGINPPDVSATNVDDDSAGIAVKADSATLSTTEGGGTATFQVSLNSQPRADVVIPITSSNTAEGKVDSSSLTFTTSNWKGWQTVTIKGVDDSVADGNQTYRIGIGPAKSDDAQYAGKSAPDVSVSNTDDDSAGITVSGASDLSTSEDGLTASFKVVLNSQPTADVVIPVVSNDETEGTASPSSLTFTTSNWNAPQAVTVKGVNDDVVDGDQDYKILLGLPTTQDKNYADKDPADVSVINKDNDSPGIVVSPTSGLETTESGGTASFSVSLQSQPLSDVTVPIASSRSTEGVATPSTLKFTPLSWKAEQKVTVMGVNDDIADGNQTFEVQVGPAASDDKKYSGIWGKSVSVSNRDIDTPGVIVSPTSGLATTEAGGTAEFTVRLQSKPVANVTISASSSNEKEGTVSPAQLSFTSANWNSPQKVTIKGVDDAIADGDQTYSILLSLASDDSKYAPIDPTDVAVKNTDNDTAGIDVAPLEGLRTTEAGGTATFTVSLRSEPRGNVTIPVSSSNEAEGKVNTSSLLFTPVDWNGVHTVTVTGVDDAIADGDQKYTILLGSASSSDGQYDKLDPSDVAVINADNDIAAVVVDAAPGLTTTEAGGKVAFSVFLNSKPTGEVTIPIESSNINEGIVDKSSLTFSAANWNTPQLVTVMGFDDAVQDGNQLYTIRLSPTSSTDSNYNGIDPNDVTVTNQDDDTAGILVTPTTPLFTSEDGGTSSFSVQLTSRPEGTATVTIQVQSSDETEGTLDRTSITFSTDDWNKAQKVIVKGVDDDLVDGDQVYSITFGPISSGDSTYTKLPVPSPIKVTNQDDDQYGILVTPTMCTTVAGGAGATFEIVLTHAPTGPVTIALGIDPAIGPAVAPISVQFTPDNWSTPQKVAVTGFSGPTGTTMSYSVKTDAAVSADPNYAGKDPVDVACTNVTP